ncbi:MAG: response regulator [Bacteroidales bacterium]|nr:response regulator [Candidatus Cryptobacteroides caccocaballi]
MSKYTVLAVDDIQLNLLLLKKMLSKFNFTLQTASSGQQTLDMIAEKKPDLILLDLMMPGIDGFEVIQRLRANPETQDIHIIILSALNSHEDIVKGFKLGANDFITKPIIMEKLFNSVITQFKLIEAKQ